MKRLRPEAVPIFILPPSREALQQRLTSRGRDQDDIIQQRMSQAVDEISHYAEADYIVVNDQFDKALEELVSVVESQRLRVDVQIVKLQDLLTDLLS